MDNILYRMMITNIQSYIKKHNPEDNPDMITSFQFSEVLAIAIGKLKEDIIMDIVSMNIDDTAHMSEDVPFNRDFQFLYPETMKRFDIIPGIGKTSTISAEQLLEMRGVTKSGKANVENLLSNKELDKVFENIGIFYSPDKTTPANSETMDGLHAIRLAKNLQEASDAIFSVARLGPPDFKIEIKEKTFLQMCKDTYEQLLLNRTNTPKPKNPKKLPNRSIDRTLNPRKIVDLDTFILETIRIIRDDKNIARIWISNMNKEIELLPGFEVSARLDDRKIYELGYLQYRRLISRYGVIHNTTEE